jgi:hypothetical protein
MNNTLRFFTFLLFTCLLFSCSKKKATFREIIANGKNWNVVESELIYMRSDNALKDKKVIRSFKLVFHPDNSATMLQSGWLISQHTWFQDLNTMLFKENSSLPIEFQITDIENEGNQVWIYKKYKGTATTISELEWRLTQ